VFTVEYHDTFLLRETFGFTVRLRVNADGHSSWVDLTVEAHLPPQVTKESVREPVLLVGLAKLRALLEAEGSAALGADLVRIEVDPDEVLALVITKERKKCAFQHRTPRGLTCAVGTAVKLAVTPADATTYPVCDACGHPDDRIRCSELMARRHRHLAIARGLEAAGLGDVRPRL